MSLLAQVDLLDCMHVFSPVAQHRSCNVGRLTNHKPTDNWNGCDARLPERHADKTKIGLELLPLRPSLYLLGCQSTCRSTDLSVSLSFFLSISFSFCLSVCLSIYLSIYRFAHISFDLSFYSSIYCSFSFSIF